MQRGRGVRETDRRVRKGQSGSACCGWRGRTGRPRSRGSWCTMTSSPQPASHISKNWMDFVQPGRAATEAVPGPGLMPHIALSKDDLPVLERPVRAISGSGSADGSSCAATWARMRGSWRYTRGVDAHAGSEGRAWPLGRGQVGSGTHGNLVMRSQKRADERRVADISAAQTGYLGVVAALALPQLKPLNVIKNLRV